MNCLYTCTDLQTLELINELEDSKRIGRRESNTHIGKNVIVEGINKKEEIKHAFEIQMNV